MLMICSTGRACLGISLVDSRFCLYPVKKYRMLRRRRGLAAVGKLTEIVEVENETWQGAKFGVC